MSASAGSRPAPLWPAPDLRVVPLDTIWVHENLDPLRFVALRDVIGQQRILANPVVVSSVTPAAPGKPRFVHLDGANRLAALRALGCTQVVVQVVDLYQPQQVQLSTWAHRTCVDLIDFFGHLQRLPEVDIQPLRQAGEAMQDTAAAFIFCKQGTYQLSLRRPTVVNRVAALQAVVALYCRCIERYKLPLLPEPQVVARHLATGTPDEPHHVLLTFVPLRVEDFLALASQGIPVPPGVTRFVLHGGRALGLNVPLSILGPSTCPTRANDWLATLREVQPVIVPGPCRMQEYLGWREYDDDEPLLVYHAARGVNMVPERLWGERAWRVRATAARRA